MLTIADYTPASVLDLTIVKPMTAQMALANLCYRSDTYSINVGYYGDVRSKIIAAVKAGVVALPIDPRSEAQEIELAVAQTLAAVAYRLNRIPKIAVESEGSQERRTFMSSVVNWEELARDILDVLYLPVGKAGSMSGQFLVVDRLLYDTQCRHFLTADEAMLSMAGWGKRYIIPYVIGRIGW